jgi:hypothetical protein
MDWIIREEMEIELHPDNVNREDSLFLSQAWEPVIHDLKNGDGLTQMK